MTRYCAFILFLLFGATRVYAQSIYTIEGTIDADTGMMVLFAHDDDAYLPQGVAATAMVSKGKFTFTNTIEYPCQVILGLKIKGSWKYLSNTFYIDPGNQSVVCHVNSQREVPVIMNSSMKEYDGDYKQAYNDANNKVGIFFHKRDSLEHIYGKELPKEIKASIDEGLNGLYDDRDAVLLHYVKAHNASYVALWELVNSVQKKYKPVYDSIFKEFSDAVKNSHTGQALAKKLATAEHLTMGSVFPQMLLRDTVNVQQNIPKINSTVKYTLVDFWFTHCAACKSQFPEMKKLYVKHHKKGFEIIAISTDQEQYVADWKKMIIEKELHWPQYIDVAGVLTHALAINAFPRNYLLDKDGKIIRIDISPDELKVFLEDEGL